MKNNLSVINTTVFTAVAITHLFRLICKSPVVFAGVEIAYSLSVLAVIVAGYLAYMNWQTTERTRLTAAKLAGGLLLIDAVACLYLAWAGLTVWGLTPAVLLAIAVVEIVVVASLCIYYRKA